MVDEQEHSDDVRDRASKTRKRHGCVADMEKQIIRQDEQLVALREKIASAYETNGGLRIELKGWKGCSLIEASLDF